jgi:hypothetical protein
MVAKKGVEEGTHLRGEDVAKAFELPNALERMQSAGVAVLEI